MRDDGLLLARHSARRPGRIHDGDALGRPGNIAEIAKERLRRAVRMIRNENPVFTGDLGFRVFKLDTSYIRAWEPRLDDLVRTLFDSMDHVKADRSEDDIPYELLAES